ncbi:hypothetical protein FOZ63_018547 [Perkinsus olseni]|uniref:Uncharacterized protein n=1 Tax=Perkinsus olseni TaxID=32597 RepID=A0A7J6U442_PEROL|nr:hypothetical protein FOZ62_016944 [Perkinsus olseni]KAF4752459.1 hypothetical protein FOZ63_018547 [Perkinsus olseni]
MPRSIRELKLASGRIFLLLEGGTELYRVTHHPSMNIEMVGKLPLGGSAVPRPSIRPGQNDHRDVIQDVLMKGDRVTHVLFVPQECTLGVWRPDDFVFKAVQAPRFCCCRFVPRTNGTVVAGVFGGSWGRSFSVYEQRLDVRLRREGKPRDIGGRFV